MTYSVLIFLAGFVAGIVTFIAVIFAACEWELRKPENKDLRP